MDTIVMVRHADLDSRHPSRTELMDAGEAAEFIRNDRAVRAAYHAKHGRWPARVSAIVTR
jgi:hypothetical protein